MLKHIMRKGKVVNFVDKEIYEWNTDLIETKKLENYTCQVAQDQCSGEAQHEPRGAYTNCRSLHETFGNIDNAVARKET